jgi:hypothetical protein
MGGKPTPKPVNLKPTASRSTMKKLQMFEGKSGQSTLIITPAS